MDDKEREKYGKKLIGDLQKNTPSFLSELDKEFPWCLRYCWLIIIFLVLASSEIGLLVGYLLEPEKEYNK